jgi:hypothetical protein
MNGPGANRAWEGRDLDGKHKNVTAQRDGTGFLKMSKLKIRPAES